MVNRMLREVGILGFFLFMFLFMVGVFTTNIDSHIILASTELPHYFLFDLSRSLANLFFFVMGKSTYFMVFVFFSLLISFLFQLQVFLQISLRLFFIIVSGTILSGIFSPSYEWIEGGVIGNFAHDLFSGAFINILSGFIFGSLIFYQAYFIIFALVGYFSSPGGFKKFFYVQSKKRLTQEFIVESSFHSLPILIKDMIQKQDLEENTVEEILLSLEKEEMKIGLSEIYSYVHYPDIFGKLLVEFIHHIYQIQKQSLTQIRQNHLYSPNKDSQNHQDLKNLITLKDKPALLDTGTVSYHQNIVEIHDYIIHPEEKAEDNGWNPSIAQNIIDDTSHFLVEQFAIKERLDDIFSSLHASFSLPSFILDTMAPKVIKESIPYAKEQFISSVSIANDIEDTQDIEPKTMSKDTQEENDHLEDYIHSLLDSIDVLEEEELEKSLGAKFIEEEELEDQEDTIDFLDIDIKPTPEEQIEYESLGTEFIGEEELEEDIENELDIIDSKNISFGFPPLELLKNSTPLEESEQEDKDFIGDQIINILSEFNIQAELDKIIVGPVVTRYEIKPPKGLKVNKITELDDNIALGLASKDRIRIEAPVFGKSVVGIEVPNLKREVVTFKDIADTFEDHFNKEDYHIPFLMGKSLDGDILIRDLVKMPHLLIAGSTGSGKSVCVNTLINSILYYKDPSEVKLLLVDPKRVELILYDGLPHLITPVIKETPEAIKALKWLVVHMEERYTLLEEKQVRNINEYNQMQIEKGLEKMPYIVVVMDEFADLILLGKRDVEESVIRLAAMARAVGIHLVLATQRPSADVITGLIKANFPSRIAFKVSSKMESRIILDENGAENLLGKGDMLFLSSDGGAMTQRVQSPLMSDEEVRGVCGFFKERYTSNYWDEIIETDIETEGVDTDLLDEPLFKEAVDIVVKEKKASASYLQRRLKVGYNRAARMIETMEEMGIISRANGSRPREILMDEWEW